MAVGTWPRGGLARRPTFTRVPSRPWTSRAPRPASSRRSGPASSATTRPWSARSACAGSPTPTTRRRAGRWPSSRTSSARRSCRCTATPTPSRRAPASRRPGSARTPGGSSATRSARTPRDHVVLFAGSGSTGAIDKLLDCLEIRLPADLDDRYDLARPRPGPTIGRSCSSGPYEHHSNELPWRESLADVVVIPEDHDGRIDLAPARGGADRARGPAAEDRLVLGGVERDRRPQRRPSDLDPAPPPRRAVVLGLRGGGAVCLDRDGPVRRAATTGPRSPTRTRSSSRPTSSSADPGRPGVLVARRELFRNRVPSVPGGGTVAYVNPTEHRYLDRHRASRGGRHAGDRRIDPGRPRLRAQGGGRRRGDPRARGVVHPPGDRALVAAHPNIEILGNPALDRLSIVSFVVRSTPARDGRRAAISTTTTWSRCSTTCSGSSRAAVARAPGRTATACSASTSTRSHEFEREIGRGCEGIKPGWVRVNFNYFISEAVFEFILGAVELVATDGWRLLPHYRFEPASGLWQPRRRDGRAADEPARRRVSTSGG